MPLSARHVAEDAMGRAIQPNPANVLTKSFLGTSQIKLVRAID